MSRQYGWREQDFWLAIRGLSLAPGWTLHIALSTGWEDETRLDLTHHDGRWDRYVIPDTDLKASLGSAHFQRALFLTIADWIAQHAVPSAPTVTKTRHIELE